MEQPQTCPSCGAKNAGSASWCNQCYASLGAPQPPAEGAAAQAQAIETQPVASEPNAGEAGAEIADTAVDTIPVGSPAPPAEPAGPPAATWVCKTCDTVNSVELGRCSACNTSIFTTFGAASEDEPLLEPNEAMRYAIVPGLAHLKMDHGMHGITIGVLVAALWFMGILFLVGGEILVALALIVISLAILGVSVTDAIRIAERRPDEILLKPRTLTMIGGLAVMMVIAVIWNQGLVS